MVRLPVFAGSFYDADPSRLREQVLGFIDTAEPVSLPGQLRGLVAPHAGYVYSGPIAGTAYKALQNERGNIGRVLLLGPSHRVPFSGLALSHATQFRTPLGDLSEDQALRALVCDLPGVKVREDAHEEEHSLEVQLPFLQVALGGVPFLPVVVGRVPPAMVRTVLGTCLDEFSDLAIVVSSDLSHFLEYAQARVTDEATARQIESLDTSIAPEQACGCHPLNGLLLESRHRGWLLERLDIRNSGDTCGDKVRVVGYGAFAACSR